MMITDGEQVRLRENIHTPVTPPAAICSPEQSRRFQPQQASPSSLLSPPRSLDKGVVDETRQAEIVLNFDNRSRSDDPDLKEIEMLEGTCVLD